MKLILLFLITHVITASAAPGINSNSSRTPLAAGATFTGTFQEFGENNSSVTVAALANQDGTLYVDFSDDCVNALSTLTFTVNASLNEVHRFTKTRVCMRTRFTNGAVAQTTFWLSTNIDNQPHLTSNLNSVIQQDADAMVTRTIGDEIAIASGLFQNYSIVNKFGYNSDIDTGTVPEDIWDGGGAYTGFPSSTLETISVLSSSADDASAGSGARTVRLIGLDSDYNVISETVTLNGTNAVATTQQFRRMHTASTQSAGLGGVNAGTITFRHTTTTSNVFAIMQIGKNQTYVSAYTVPAGHTAYMRALTASLIQGTASASSDGQIWIRSFSSVFRGRRPFLLSTAINIADQIYGGLIFTEKSDIILRVNAVSNSNSQINGGYDLILVKN